MRRKWILALLSLLLLANLIACKKNGNFTNIVKASHKNENILHEKANENRIKRSLQDENEKSFMPLNSKLFDFDLEEKDKKINSDAEEPFWGTRGRRDSSEENLGGMYNSNPRNYDYSREICNNCYKNVNSNALNRRDDTISPFWGNRGRRNSDEIEDNIITEKPFWGNRGRRQEDEPFWGNRGRREETKSKTEKISSAPFWKNNDVTEPFWGNRGRRREAEAIHHVMHEETEPFWGNRGRRETIEPFWGSRGRKKDKTQNGINEESDPFWENKGRGESGLKDNIINAMKYIEDNVENLSRLRRGNNMETPFWSNRVRDSKLLNLFKGFGGSRLRRKPNPMESETVLNDRIYAEQPRYILVERSSRSSAEDDPFFISRGKKFTKTKFLEASRGRRATIEELVKSVRNDPFYIARGKKIVENIKFGNSSILKEEFEKAEELICSTIDLLTMKDKEKEVKREINDNERNRRTILKKLAAQLKVDPYFVSRGKKSGIFGENGEHIEEFITQVAAMCY